MLDMGEPERRVAGAKYDQIRMDSIGKLQNAFGCVPVFDHGLRTAPLVGWLWNHLLQRGFEGSIQGFSLLGSGLRIGHVAEINVRAAVLCKRESEDRSLGGFR